MVIAKVTALVFFTSFDDVLSNQRKAIMRSSGIQASINKCQSNLVTSTWNGIIRIINGTPTKSVFSLPLESLS
jgi:hypothetical protein